MKTLPSAAVLVCVGMFGLSFRPDLLAAPKPGSVSPTQVQAEGCSCLAGETCTCGNCRCGEANSELQSFTALQSDMNARIMEQLQQMEGRLTAIEVQQDLAALVPDISRIPIEENPLQEVPTLAMEPEKAADAQPTPYDVIFKAIDLLDLKNTETLLDFGCGGDARVLIHAFHDAGCKGVGVELDPARAASARSLVNAVGLSPWIEIVEGDATTEPVEGSVGFVYLWPETLEELRPKLVELDRFVSYAHAVPGLTMQRIDVPGHEPLWYWERAPEVSYSERPYAVYNGRRYYSDYNPGCNCSMCRTIRSQLASRENVEQIPIQTQIPTQSAPRTSTVVTATQRQTVQRSTSGCSNCSGGNCGRPRFRGRR